MKVFRQIGAEFVDYRGAITHLVDDGHTTIKSILLITSKAGSVRANHYHKTDFHYCYLIKGRMEYIEQPVGADGSTRQSVILETGDMVYTDPMVMHAMRFLEDSAFFAFAKQSRHQTAYEEDTVRVSLV